MEEVRTGTGSESRLHFAPSPRTFATAKGLLLRYIFLKRKYAQCKHPDSCSGIPAAGLGCPMMGADKWAPGTGLKALLGWDEGHSHRDIGTTVAQEVASWVLF